MQERQIQKMINELIHRGSESKIKVQFVRHYNDFSIEPEYVKDVIEESGFLFFFHEFSLENMQSAYEPILDWIKVMIDHRGDMEVRDFLKKCEVYPLHYDIIESFYFSGECKRKEDILLHELEYEQSRMLDNMIHILKKISKNQPIFMLLNKIHYAQSSTIQFLNEIIHKLEHCNVYVLGVYNEAYSGNINYLDEWKKFIELTEKNCNVATWVGREKIQENQMDEFLPNVEEFSDYLIKINNMLEFGAYFQAEYYLNLMQQKVENEKIYLDSKIWYAMNLLSLRTYIYLNDESSALRISNTIKSKNHREKVDDHILFMADYYICMSQIRNFRNELVKSCIENCRDIEKRTKKPEHLLRLKIMEIISKHDGFDSKRVRYVQEECDLDFVQILEKHGFLNHLAYYYLNCLGNTVDSIKSEDLEQEEEAIYEKGLKIAQSIDNDNCIIVFYHARIVISSSVGCFTYPEKYFKKIMPYIEKAHSKASLCKILNGLGYVTCVNGAFSKSHDYYIQALQVEKELGDTKLIAETLYNMCIMCFLAKDYKNAIRYIEMAIEIIEGMGHYFFVCNISKVYGLAALSNHYDNNEYSCYFYLDKMKRFIGHLLRSDDERKKIYWDDDLMLYYFISALIHKKEEKYKEALDYFLTSKKHLFKTPGFLFFGYPILALELSDCYEKMQESELAEQELNEAIVALKKEKYFSLVQELEARKNKIAYENQEHHLNIRKELEIEIKTLYNEAVMKRVNKRFLNHSEFLSLWQNVISEKDTVNEVYENAFPVALNHFCADQMLIFSKSNGALSLSASFYQEKIEEKELKIIEKFAKSYPNGFVVSRMEKEFNFFKEVISIFRFDEIVSFMMVPYIKNKVVEGVAILYINMREDFRNIPHIFDSEGLVMFKVAYRQMVDLIEKIEASETIKSMNERLLSVNKRLEESVVTDALTGIFNREGYARKEAEIENQKEFTDCVVLYFDLDNFKYYNDSFGHDIGDFVLVRLAEILKGLAEEKGIPIRYGGDEFLLIVPGISIAEAEKIAEEFYEILGQKEYFIPQIEKKLHKFVHIPPERRISSSIGIAKTDYLSGCDLEMAIRHADSALYCVKKTCKKSYRVWQEENETK